MTLLKKNIPWQTIIISSFSLFIFLGIGFIGFNHFNSLSKPLKEKIHNLEKITTSEFSNKNKEISESLNSIKIEIKNYYYNNIKFLLYSSVTIILIAFLLLLTFYIVFKRSIIGITRHISDALQDQSAISIYSSKHHIFRPLISYINNLINLNNQLKLKLEVIPVPVIELDNNYHISFMNSASADLLKCDKTSALGKLCKDVLNSEKCQGDNCPCRHACQSSGVISVDTKIVFADERQTPVEFTVVPFEKGPKEKGFIICLTDLSLMGNIVGEVKRITEQLNSTSDHLSLMASQMMQSTDDIVKLSEQSAINIDSMATLGEEMSENVSSQAESAMNMTKSLKDVSINTAKANQISRDANIKTTEVNTKMKALVEASEQIGKVITVINDIADRTDLLALNAAIEAEGAGMAGKGFAVVADEVQKLAKQSADATDEIAQEIENIQTSTQDAVQAMEKISTIIDEIASINEKNAVAVQEQTQTAANISSHTNQTVQAGLTVANGANEAHNLVNDISDKIKQTANQADATNKTSQELAAMASELMEIINQLNL
ncbi:Methyl-accepting chemotaxis sensory transducer with Pas/Pac sensor [Candidatus Magnetomorum sp. HK-1]|nr:Methyl-accepting chemotaxis sensory transducer with Pas/Pac sensor [Candidatus Magnetomorum sp. HK-1]